MIRSLSTAVTGMRGHQQKLDVIGNNIANVNTIGFKKSQARFSDLFSQTIQGATGPADRGGINPSQIGLGMRVSSITDIHSQGAVMGTDRVTDLAIEGEGYFIVTDRIDGTGRIFFTRNGSFGLDANGTMVNDNGLILCNSDGVPIVIPIGDQMVAQATENIRFAGNLDSRLDPQYSVFLDGATGGSFDINIGIDDGTGNIVTVTANLAFDATAADIQTALTGLLGAGVSVDAVTVTGQGTEISPFIIRIDQHSPADSTIRLTVDGNAPSTIPPIPPPPAPQIPADPLTGPAPTVTSQPGGHVYEYFIFDSLGNRYSVDYHFTKVQDEADQKAWDYTVRVFDENGDEIPQALLGGTSGTLIFDTAGNLLGVSNTPALTYNPPGADPITVTPNFEDVTQLAGNNSLVAREQDGYGAGTLVAFNIGRTGQVIGTYTNGMMETLGQIEIATFPNPEGLQKEGGNLFVETANSGDPNFGMPGTGMRGLIQSSALEMSNVDLAYEFTELITTSRAFQANTRVVTTSDEILVEVVNMKR